MYEQYILLFFEAHDPRLFGAMCVGENQAHWIWMKLGMIVITTMCIIIVLVNKGRIHTCQDPSDQRFQFNVEIRPVDAYHTIFPVLVKRSSQLPKNQINNLDIVTRFSLDMVRMDKPLKNHVRQNSPAYENNKQPTSIK